MGTEVAHVTRVSDSLGHHFQGQKVKCQLAEAGIMWRPPALLVGLICIAQTTVSIVLPMLMN